jgi:hypothetical protein
MTNPISNSRISIIVWTWFFIRIGIISIILTGLIWERHNTLALILKELPAIQVQPLIAIGIIVITSAILLDILATRIIFLLLHRRSNELIFIRVPSHENDTLPSTSANQISSGNAV